MPPSDDFSLPDFEAPLDLEQRIARARPTSTVKGMFLHSIVEHATQVSGRPMRRGPYVRFKNYPFREWLETSVECARIAHPRVPVREGLRRLGQLAYPTFVDSTLGKVL